MKIEKSVCRYIEYELYHYEQYKREIQESRNSDPPLLTSNSLKSMENVVAAVDAMYKSLSETHCKLFEAYYVWRKRGIYNLCTELGISEATYARHKRSIIEFVGRELGVIKS